MTSRNTIIKRNQRARDKAKGLIEKIYKTDEEGHKVLKNTLREYERPKGNTY